MRVPPDFPGWFFRPAVGGCFFLSFRWAYFIPTFFHREEKACHPRRFRSNFPLPIPPFFSFRAFPPEGRSLNPFSRQSNTPPSISPSFGKALGPFFVSPSPISYTFPLPGPWDFFSRAEHFTGTSLFFFFVCPRTTLRPGDYFPVPTFFHPQSSFPFSFAGGVCCPFSLYGTLCLPDVRLDFRIHP